MSAERRDTECWTGTEGCSGIRGCVPCRADAGHRSGVTIVGLVRQIDGCNERIRTLESEKAQLQRELVAMEAQRDEARTERDTANGKVFQYTRRGW